MLAHTCGLKNTDLTDSTPHKWGDHITHPALTLDSNAHAAQRIGKMDANRMQPVSNEPISGDMAVLSAT